MLPLKQLKLLRIIAFAGALSDKADIIGFDGLDMDETLNALQQGGLIENDHIITPTPRGTEVLESWYAEDRARLNDADRIEMHERFRPMDRELKRLASAWQNAVARDDWDGRLSSIEALSALNDDALAFIATFAASVPRFSEFKQRLEHALAQVLDGETDFFVGMRCDSYHTIWFNFHEDLLRLLQQERDIE